MRELRNLVERITILSSNESKEKINLLIDDILNPSLKISNESNILSQSSSFKRSREFFEKVFDNTTKKTSETFQKQQTLLVWKDLHFIESQNH